MRKIESAASHLLGSTTYEFSAYEADRCVWVGWNAVDRCYEVTVFDSDDDVVLTMAGEYDLMLPQARRFADINPTQAQKLYRDSQPPEELIPDETREDVEE